MSPPSKPRAQNPRRAPTPLHPHSALRTPPFDMGAVSETIVREFFELHGFFVRQQRKYIAPTRREDEEIDLFVLNPHPAAGGRPPPFVLAADELPAITRAVVVVKGWHTESFSS